MAVSKVPIADWAALLKESWGPIKITHVGWLLGDRKLYIPYRMLSP